MHSQERGSHVELAARGALLWGEDTAVSGWVVSGAALFICLSPATQEVRQAKRDPKRRGKKKKKKWRGGKISRAPMPSFRRQAMERENRAQLSKAAD